MQRLILLALLCLAGIVSLFAVRIAEVVNTVKVVPATTISAEVRSQTIIANKVDLVTPALTKKGNRLPSRLFDDTLSNTPIETVQVVPTELPRPSAQPAKQTEASKDEIVSWHWHEGSKVVRRRRAQ